MSCKYCDFNQKEKNWEIELYESASYKYECNKYFLEVTYPADGKHYHNVKPVEVNYCPKCGRKLNEYSAILLTHDANQWLFSDLDDTIDCF